MTDLVLAEFLPAAGAWQRRSYQGTPSGVP